MQRDDDFVNDKAEEWGPTGDDDFNPLKGPVALPEDDEDDLPDEDDDADDDDTDDIEDE